MTKQSSNEPDPRILSILQRGETTALLVVVTAAVLTLALSSFPYIDARPAHMLWKMTENTAIGMLFAAGSLAFTIKQYPLRLVLGGAAASVVLVLGLLTLAEYFGHISLGIDTWLPYDHQCLYPGSLSLQTSLGFVLLATSLLTIHEDKGGWKILADVSAFMLVVSVLVMFGGYVYCALDLVGINAVTFMSALTLLSFACFAFISVIGRAKQGNILAILINVGSGDRVIRTTIPAAIVIPFIFFSAEAYVIESTTMRAPYVCAIASAAASLLILCIVTWIGRNINALERELRDLALTDELTSICNLRGFYFLGQQAIRDADRADTGLTLFFFDLDGLKYVNDVFGHETGSNLIQAFASVLVKTFRKSDIIGRVGGDEFAVLTIRDGGVKLNEIINRLEHCTTEFNNASEKRFTLRFSVGYAALNHGSSETLDDMVNRADAMMYQNKAKKKLIYMNSETPEIHTRQFNL